MTYVKLECLIVVHAYVAFSVLGFSMCAPAGHQSQATTNGQPKHEIDHTLPASLRPPRAVRRRRVSIGPTNKSKKQRKSIASPPRRKRAHLPCTYYQLCRERYEIQHIFCLLSLSFPVNGLDSLVRVEESSRSQERSEPSTVVLGLTLDRSLCIECWTSPWAWIDLVVKKANVSFVFGERGSCRVLRLLALYLHSGITPTN